MGKINELQMKKYRNNVRVDPATLSHYLCYYCGRMSSDRLDHQQHMLKVHEVMSQSYQLWSDHTMDTLGLRWTGSKEDSSVPASPVSKIPKTRDSDDGDEDYVYEEEEKPSKRRKKEDEKAKKLATIERQKKVIEEQKRRQEAETKRRKRAEEKRKTEKMRESSSNWEDAIAIIQATEPSPSVEAEESIEKSDEKSDKKRKKKTTECPRWKEISSSEGDKPEVTALVRKILEESKRKEASSQEVEDDELTIDILNRRRNDSTIDSVRYCRICKKGTHFTFETLFEHYLEHHHASLKSFHYYGYRGRELIGSKLLTERDYCQRCVLKFTKPREYFIHMIRNHIHESVRCQLDFENATNADVEVRFGFRDRTLVMGYNFTFETIPTEKIDESSSIKTEKEEPVAEKEEEKPTTSEGTSAN